MTFLRRRCETFPNIGLTYRLENSTTSKQPIRIRITRNVPRDARLSTAATRSDGDGHENTRETKASEERAESGNKEISFCNCFLGRKFCAWNSLSLLTLEIYRLKDILFYRQFIVVCSMKIILEKINFTIWVRLKVNLFFSKYAV